MRICLYTNTALPKLGGQEIVVDALARQFLALGHEPVVLAPWRTIAWPVRRGFGALRGGLASAVPVHALVRAVVWSLAGEAAPHPPLRRDPLPRDLPGGLRGACCKAMCRVPLVITSHGDDLAPLGLYDRKPELRERYRTALAQSRRRDSHQRLYGPVVSPGLSGIAADRRYSQRRQRATFATAAPRPADLDRTIEPRQYSCSSADSTCGKASMCC